MSKNTTKTPEGRDARKCYGCCLLKTFTPRPDERERYGFGDVGYGCDETGYEGYVNPERPICLRGPYPRASVQP